MKSSASRLSRRNFLLAVGSGGAVAAAATIATKSSPSQGKKAEAVTGSKGYHVTEHIRKYYSTTKI
jgi:ATP-dependent protease HslVU (ClpYQ) peptidase subunit